MLLLVLGLHNSCPVSSQVVKYGFIYIRPWGIRSGRSRSRSRSSLVLCGRSRMWAEAAFWTTFGAGAKAELRSVSRHRALPPTRVSQSQCIYSAPCGSSIGLVQVRVFSYAAGPQLYRIYPESLNRPSLALRLRGYDPLRVDGRTLF